MSADSLNYQLFQTRSTSPEMRAYATTLLLSHSTSPPIREGIFIVDRDAISPRRVLMVLYATTVPRYARLPFEAVPGPYVLLAIFVGECWLIEINQKTTEDVVKPGMPTARRVQVECNLNLIHHPPLICSRRTGGPGPPDRTRYR